MILYFLGNTLWGSKMKSALTVSFLIFMFLMSSGYWRSFFVTFYLIDLILKVHALFQVSLFHFVLSEVEALQQ